MAPVFGSATPTGANLSAFGLEDGRRAWTLSFTNGEELHAVVHCQGETYPITLAAALGTAGATGAVHLLDEKSGSLRRIAPLKPGERLMGVAPHGSLELAEPYWFAYSFSESERSVPVRALHLPYGLAWTWSLPVAQNESYDGRELAMPAVSDSTVALAVPIRRSGGTPLEETALVFLDKRAGRKLDQRVLGGPLSGATRLELRGLGEALFVQGRSPSGRGTGLDILEALR